MIKYTITNLKKIEDLFKALAYKVRYEKGHFKSGYCLVENKNIVVINRFFDTEARMNALLDILSFIKIDLELFDEKQTAYYHEAMKIAPKKEEA